MSLNKRIKMTMIEPTNITHLENIINNIDVIEKHGITLDLFNKETKEFKYKNLLPILEKYLKKVNNIHSRIGKVEVKYIQSKNETNLNKKGRIYPMKGLGVVAFHKLIRQYILTDTDLKTSLIWDCDLKNSHPTIYLFWLEQQGCNIEGRFPLLVDYVKNTEKWKFKYPQIKKQVLIVMNGAQIVWSDTLEGFTEEVEKLIQEIVKSREWIRKKHNIPKNEHEKLKTLIYDENCRIEREIIDYSIDYINDRVDNTQEQVSYYSYDGFGIPNTGKFYNNPEKVCKILKELSKNLKDTIGIDISIVLKQFDYNSEVWLNFLKIMETEGGNKYRSPKEPNINLNGKYLGEVITENLFLNVKENINVFKSSMGDGKTRKLWDDIETLRKTEQGTSRDSRITILSLLNRRTLIKNLYEDYKNYTNIQNYLDWETETHIDGVGMSTIICTESLHKLTTQTLKNCKILILDELESVLPQFQSTKTHGEFLSVNQYIFIGLIRNAEKIIVMDANITYQTIDFLINLRKVVQPTKCNVKWYEIEPVKPKNVSFYETYEELEGKIIQSLNNGENLFIPNTKSIVFGDSMIKTITEKTGIPREKLLYLNKDTKDLPEIIPYIQDTNKWSDFRVVMISPTITSGVSNMLSNHFSQVFCIFTNKTSNPLDSSQMIGRVRKPITNNIHIWLDEQFHERYNKPPQTEKKLLQCIMDNTNDFFKTQKNEIGTWKYNFEEFKETLVLDERSKLWMFNTIQQNKFYYSYKFYLRVSLQNSYKCNFITDPTSVENEEKETEETEGKQSNTREYVKDFKEKEYKQIFDSKDIVFQDIQNLKKQQLENTEPHKWEIKKFFETQTSRLIDGRLEKYRTKFIESLDTEGTDGELYPNSVFKRNLDLNIKSVTKSLSLIFKFQEYDKNSIREIVEKLSKTSSLTNVSDILSDEEDPYNLPLEIPKNINVSEESLFHYITTSSNKIPFKPENSEDIDEKLNTHSLDKLHKSPIVQILWCEKLLNILFPNRIHGIFQKIFIEVSEIETIKKRFSSHYLEGTNGLSKRKGFQTYKQRYKDLFGIIKTKTELSELSNEKFISLINEIISHLGMKFSGRKTKRIKDPKDETGKKKISVEVEGWDLQLKYPVLLHSSLQDIVQVEKRNLKTRRKSKEFELSNDILPVIISDEHLFKYDMEHLKNTIFYEMKY